MFKHVKGKNGTTSSLSLGSKKGGTVTYIKDKDAIYLTEYQTRYIFKRVEQGNDLNTETMKWEIEQEKMTEIRPSEENENLCQKVVLIMCTKRKTKQCKWKISQF